MACTSRKNITQATSATKAYRAAAYLRLLVSKPNQDCDSIRNQQNVIENYISGRLDIKIEKIFVDKNVSGISFERDGFQKMLSTIERGDINCVIVKDLSRLGRDFLEAGYYIEQYFPSRKIRFIAVSDEFDTTNGIANNNRPEAMNGIRIPITNLFNEKYAEDIQKKTQSSIDYLIRHGKYVAPRAPYG